MTRYLMHPMTTDPRVFGFNTEDATPPIHGARTEPNSTLLPHQQRVLDEKAARDGEISRLDAFINAGPIFATLPTDEQARLRRQLDVMRELSVILGERIANF